MVSPTEGEAIDSVKGRRGKRHPRRPTGNHQGHLQLPIASLIPCRWGSNQNAPVACRVVPSLRNRGARPPQKLGQNDLLSEGNCPQVTEYPIPKAPESTCAGRAGAYSWRRLARHVSRLTTTV